MGKARWLSPIGRGGSWIFAAKLLVSLVAIVFAASISVTSTTYQTEVGSALNVANGLVAVDKGFSLSLAAASATLCSSPVTFGALSGTANTAISIGHTVYDVQVNSTISAPANHNFTVTLTLASSTFPPVCIKTPATPLNLQTIDCKFDVGTTLPASPYTFKVTIQ